MTLAAGKLTRRITIQRRDSGRDAAGQPVQTWSDVVTVWAQPAGDTGLSTIRASADLPVPIKRYSFRIRYREGLTEGMRVVDAGQPFDITAVRMDLAGKQWTDLVCETGNDG